MKPSKEDLRKILTDSVRASPNWWWVRPFYDNPLFAPGYRVGFTYTGVMPDLEECSEQIRSSIVGALNGLTDDEFNNHPSLLIQVGPILVNFYIGGPGAEPCCK